jgi:disulfide oxidoreductase YuzD
MCEGKYYYLQIAKWDFQDNYKCILCPNTKLVKNLLLNSRLREQIFKVEYETILCWLKSCDLNKVISKVVQEGRLYELINIVQSFVAYCST